MKNLLMVGVVFAAVVAMGADTKKKDAYDIRPTAAAAADAPSAVDWQNANDETLAEATSPESLAAFVRNEDAAKALLAEVKGAYSSDPMKLMQISAVSQFVMSTDTSLCRRLFLFWEQTRDEQRQIWTAALMAAARSATDSYVQVFMLDQLRWCGYPRQAPEVSVLRASSDKAVAAMAELVATELSRAR